MLDKNQQAIDYSSAAIDLIQAVGEDKFINAKDVPDFVSNLYQSLDYSMRYAAGSTGLLNVISGEDKSIERDIKFLDELISERLHVPKTKALASAISHCVDDSRKRGILMEMISGHQFEETRNTLKNGRKSEGDMSNGDLSICNDFSLWAEAVNEVAVNIEKAIHILAQLRDSEGDGNNFIVYTQNQ